MTKFTRSYFNILFYDIRFTVRFNDDEGDIRIDYILMRQEKNKEISSKYELNLDENKIMSFWILFYF